MQITLNHSSHLIYHVYKSLFELLLAGLVSHSVPEGMRSSCRKCQKKGNVGAGRVQGEKKSELPEHTVSGFQNIILSSLSNEVERPLNLDLVLDLFLCSFSKTVHSLGSLEIKSKNGLTIEVYVTVEVADANVLGNRSICYHGTILCIR